MTFTSVLLHCIMAHPTEAQYSCIINGLAFNNNRNISKSKKQKNTKKNQKTKKQKRLCSVYCFNLKHKETKNNQKHFFLINNKPSFYYIEAVHLTISKQSIELYRSSPFNRFMYLSLFYYIYKRN